MPVTITTDFSSLAGVGLTDVVGGSQQFSLRLKLTNASNTELGTANGYTAGGKLLTNVRLTYSAGVLDVFADDVSWKATGGSLTAAKAILSDRGRAIATIDFGGSLTAAENTSLVVRWYSGKLYQYNML